jgi:hypothetical protein
MTQVLSGTLGEVLKQAVEAEIPATVKVRLSWEDNEHILGDEQNAAAIAYLQERLEHPLTAPEEIQQAETELAELHRNLNRNRLEAGERPLFPE